MALVDTETGEVVGAMTRTQAIRLTERIREIGIALPLLVKRSHDEGAWAAMGYPSWVAYMEAEFQIGKSHAYRMIAHAAKLAEITEAAGLHDLSPVGESLPEGVTRGLDAAAAAEAVRGAVAALPDDATDEDRAATATETVRSLTERTKTSAPAVPPAVSEEAAGPQGVVGRGMDDAGGNGSPPAPGVAPSPALETAAQRERIGRALARTSDLLALDPVEAAAVMAQDDAPVWCTAADDLADWAHEFSQAVIANRHLRSVR